MIVIDIGCARHGSLGEHYSIERLIEEFQPHELYGCDPHYRLIQEMLATYDKDPPLLTRLHLKPAAAWTYNGEIGFAESGTTSHLTLDEDAPRVECFDLAEFIRSLPEDEIVLKVDAEGAEFELLRHLIVTRTDELLDLALVEWHMNGLEDAPARRAAIEEEIDCELREWVF